MLRRPRLLLALFLLGGTALAKPAVGLFTPSKVEAPAPDATKLAMAVADVGVAVVDDADLGGGSDGQSLDTAQASVASMRASLSEGIEALTQARERKDAVRLTCVNEQVTAMKGLVRIAEDALISLQEAAGANDTERAGYELRKIEVSKNKMDGLLQAINACAGAEASSSNTSVEMEVNPGLTVVDPYYGEPSLFFKPETALADGESSTLGNDDPSQPIPPASGT
jgi:hypothetical protein